MAEYKAPLRDMRFALHEVLWVTDHYQALNKSDINRDLIDAVLEEGARYTGEVVAPLNRSGDEEGAQFHNGQVTTPAGFKGAYQQFCDNGWAAMTGPEAYGGQGLPISLAAPFHEMLMAANLSFRVYSGLTEGAVLALHSHGSQELKDTYLEKLVSGTWTGTMCLTEPQAGTDLALLRTKAEPNGDGSYAISGTKIFISGGEHDMSDNIIHLVLARLPDAPAGVKGISLFLVPKLLPDTNGTQGETNTLSCGSIEHKMGIKGAATCVMNFDGARGWLIGEANQGLVCMFTMMNDARFQVGLQGLGVAEMAYQGAVHYARERLQSRSLTGPKAPEQAADPIIVHPDVRRMLLTQKALVEGSRMMAYYVATQIDVEHLHEDVDVRAQASKRVALFIPIIKAFLTDLSLEASSLGMQVYGGHGYIREWGMEQLLRDGRITMLYEGTNGIQALDLIRRKLMGDRGAEMQRFQSEILAFCETYHNDAALHEFLAPLAELVTQWRSLTDHVLQAAQANPEEIGGAAVDYLQFSSYAALAYFWALMVKTAAEQLNAGSEDASFYQAKLATARFYFKRLLPRTKAHQDAILAGVDTLMELEAEQFLF